MISFLTGIYNIQRVSPISGENNLIQIKSGIVNSLVAGANINIDITDPANPIVNYIQGN